MRGTISPSLGATCYMSVPTCNDGLHVATAVIALQCADSECVLADLPLNVPSCCRSR